jgi:hypothetical protein
MASTTDTETPALKVIDGGKSPDKLTGKQAAFVRAMLKGAGSQSEAYRAAYDAENMSEKSIWNESSKLMRHRAVAARLTAGFKAQEEQATHTGASLRLHVEKELFDLTTKAESDQAKLRALELLGKLEKVGAFTERVSVENDNRSADEITAELEERLRAAFDQSA